MKLMMHIAPNNAQNSMDFLSMPPPNMPMNTPFVMAGERMSGARAPRSKTTPFLVNRDSTDGSMDLDLDPVDWIADSTSRMDANINDRIVYRTSGVNLTNEYNRAVNDDPSASKASDHQFKVPNAPAPSLKAAKRHLFNANNDVTMANGLSGNVNGFPSTAIPTSISNTHDNVKNSRMDVSNNHGNVSTNSNRNNDATNNIFGGRQNQPPTTNNHQNVSNDPGNSSNANNGAIFNGNGINSSNTRSNAENGLFGSMSNFTGSKNPSNEHRGTSNINQDSNGPDKVSKASVFSRLNYNAMDVELSQQNNQKYNAIFTNDNSMDENQLEDIENDDIYVDDEDDDDDGQQTNNSGQNNFNGKMITKAMQKQQTNAANLFESGLFATNGPSGIQSAGEQTANQRFGNLNQQPLNGPANSGSFFFQHFGILMGPSMILFQN